MKSPVLVLHSNVLMGFSFETDEPPGVGEQDQDIYGP